MRRFANWIRDLDEAVIHGEYGYEDGEFTVFPDHWRPMWREGLTPAQAFKRALDGFAEDRRERDREKAENWARIQREDAEAIARQKASRHPVASDGEVEPKANTTEPKQTPHPYSEGEET